MVQLELTHTQTEVLRGVLENDLWELRTEIAGTDSRPYREKLKARYAVLRAIAEQISRQETAAAEQEP
ncbi:MAG: hypothetical protein AMXMBFR53_11580 [Gemmatimonadota bacterium]